MLTIYSQHYSEDKIFQLIGLYRSDLGQKTLQLKPATSRLITTKTREIIATALTQAEEGLIIELKKSLRK